jgi:hypothetical protein
MIIVVVTLNLIIATFNLYLAIKLWQLRKLFSLITSALISCDNYLKYVLILSPQLLIKGQINIYQFRKRYQLWQLQLQKIQQIIILLNWMYRFWRKTKFTQLNS